jgi:hypothetical protein
MRGKIGAALGVLVFALAFGAAPSAGQDAGMQQKLVAQYALTKPTDDKTDIVTAGSVLILQKDGVLMYSTTSAAPPQNTYQNGKLSQGAYGVHDKVQKFGSLLGHPSPHPVQTRTFVTGEKFWVTNIQVQPDGVVFTLFTDAIQDIRYYSTLKFLYPKGAAPAPDQMLSTVGEVLKVQQDDPAPAADQGNQQQGAAAGDANQQQQPAAEQAPAAPPAPPATVQLGQTTDEVIAILGQPDKIINLGPKQIYVYKDLKVTFIKGKVTDAS